MSAASNKLATDRTAQPFEKDRRFFQEAAHVGVVHNGIGLAS
jgi:hypothetical protein